MNLPRNVIDRLRTIRGFVLDMDGTLVLGDKRNKGLHPLPGAIALTSRLRDRQIPFVVLTNGTTRPPAEYAATLRDLGFPVRDEMMLTPSAVAADYLQRRKFKRALVLGGEGVWRPLEAAGIEIVLPGKPTRPDADAVYVGWFREFTMDDLEAACQAVWAGAKLFTSSMAPFFATANGKALGTSRAITAMITSVTGQRATVLGKPALEALRCAGRRLGIATGRLAVVGDDPALEVPMAHRGGSMAIAVHTGIGDESSFAGKPMRQQPHLAVRNVAELLAIFDGLAAAG